MATPGLPTEPGASMRVEHDSCCRSWRRLGPITIAALPWVSPRGPKQRRAGKLGAGLGKTTGWIHRSALKHKDVQMVGGVNYEAIGDQGLLISHGEKRNAPTWLACDTVVLCAGQVPHRPLADELQALGRTVHVIGGALKAGELDAKRAIDQAAQLAARI